MTGYSERKVIPFIPGPEYIRTNTCYIGISHAILTYDANDIALDINKYLLLRSSTNG